MNTFLVNIYTPEAPVVSEPATYLSVPGADGSYGLLYNHMPCLIALTEGEIVLDQGDERIIALTESLNKTDLTDEVTPE